ncbi:conserved hypothetical protein [synthetic Mycoplasma mycoides JCVI-syn1.0]|uniref:DUF262 domain-containing protein n=1 Tax=Mycoplasma mycoides subsp. capri TaxID=40477 RepID=A0AB38GEJ2_MYCMC|nr:DUF262 domain-containing protein [Mycoplasma mycoides]ADH21974.1 conserved hypothetical protein [synthetic Mycoplasma mycoides JCVI-syn1.0]ACU78573.1 conserved hypothetical protein [Mycoplasma mycoides subsp. capri str. GM12]ACU79404.1 conserved hypothetical protein [Mycoplasma mycoides subsp. capri str. GM12]SRX59172.1 hypothetical protein MMC68K_00712 [Mycoplasma mycoides subsp. capri]SRX61860.1 hypothetical protein MMC68I_00715 [Mycoplasma mycoides subsp. capri]
MKNHLITVSPRSVKEMFSYLQIVEIPLYQRQYCWSKENIHSLLNDLLDRDLDDRQHFFGTITETTAPIDTDNPNGLKHRIIDGQQRLTTCLLLLHFFNSKIIRNKESNILQQSIFKEKGIKEFNLEKRSDDQESWSISEDIKKIINYYTSNELDNSEINFSDKKIKENYETIKNFFDSKKFNVNDYKRLLDIFLNKFIFSSLIYPISDPFEEMTIFENLNSKGVPLDDLDLIKNIIMLADQNKNPKDNLRQFDKYIWNLVSNGDWKNKDKEKVIRDFFEEFLKWYLKDNYKKYGSYEIYKNFKYYIKSSKEKNWSLTNILQELKKYLILYLTITKPIKANHIGNNLWIRVIDQKRVYIGLLFALFNKFSNFDTSSEEWKENITIINYMKVFSIHIIRLMSYQGTGQSLSDFCLWFEEQITKEEKTYKDLARILKDNSIKKPLNAISPDDIQVRESLLNIKDTVKWIAKGVIDVVETTILNNANEKINHTKKTTLEHIMPQTLTDEWIKYIASNENISEQDVIDKQKTYLNKIGNLCFIDLSKNSKISNDSFEDKKTKLYRIVSSPLINGSNNLKDYNIDSINSYSVWGFSQIQRRTEQIVDQFLKIINQIN